jgi:hypothetical protein
MPTIIELDRSSDYECSTYGIEYVSRHVHKIQGAKHNPRSDFSLKVWNNTDRLNPHPGVVKWNDFGSIGGDGKYLDPGNQATDEARSVTTSAEAIVISAHPISRKALGELLSVGDTVYLREPGGALLGPYVIAQRSLHDPHLEPV